MKTLLLHSFVLIQLFFTLCICSAQNLVPNPSFEQYDTCPIGQGNLYRAIGWSSYSETPDYFNSCNNIGPAGVPSNIVSFQNARTGNAYAGFYAFALYGNDTREIIGCKLNQVLNIGQEYFVNFYVNAAYNSKPGWNITFAVNKIGVRFSTKTYSYWDPVSINNFAQLYTNSIIEDTLNWVKVSGSFIADSSYEFVSFGNFFTDSATTHISIGTPSSYAYYYIDDIIISADSTFGNDEPPLINPIPLIKIYPNPITDYVIIEGDELENIMIYDLIGRNCCEEKLTKLSINAINLNSLRNGIYIMKIKTKNNTVTQKIIIQ